MVGDVRPAGGRPAYCDRRFDVDLARIERAKHGIRLLVFAGRVICGGRRKAAQIGIERQMGDTPAIPPLLDRAAINRRIDRLDVSADMKSALSRLVEATIVVAGKLVDIGARVMAFVFELAKAYPGIAFGAVVALVLSYLISSIPVVGPVLSPVLTPLLLIVGISLGALDDLTDGGMRARLANLQTQLRQAGVA